MTTRIAILLTLLLTVTSLAGWMIVAAQETPDETPVPQTAGEEPSADEPGEELTADQPRQLTLNWRFEPETFLRYAIVQAGEGVIALQGPDIAESYPFEAQTDTRWTFNCTGSRVDGMTLEALVTALHLSYRDQDTDIYAIIDEHGMDASEDRVDGVALALMGLWENQQSWDTAAPDTLNKTLAVFDLPNAGPARLSSTRMPEGGQEDTDSRLTRPRDTNGPSRTLAYFLSPALAAALIFPPLPAEPILLGEPDGELPTPRWTGETLLPHPLDMTRFVSATWHCELELDRLDATDVWVNFSIDLADETLPETMRHWRGEFALDRGLGHLRTLHLSYSGTLNREQLAATAPAPLDGEALDVNLAQETTITVTLLGRE